MLYDVEKLLKNGWSRLLIMGSLVRAQEGEQNKTRSATVCLPQAGGSGFFVSFFQVADEKALKINQIDFHYRNFCHRHQHAGQNGRLRRNEKIFRHAFWFLKNTGLLSNGRTRRAPWNGRGRLRLLPRQPSLPALDSALTHRLRKTRAHRKPV